MGYNASPAKARPRHSRLGTSDGNPAAPIALTAACGESHDDGPVRVVVLPAVPHDALGLDAAFGEVDKRYGGIEGYFGEALGLGAADQKALRDRYLT